MPDIASNDLLQNLFLCMLHYLRGSGFQIFDEIVGFNNII